MFALWVKKQCSSSPQTADTENTFISHTPIIIQLPLPSPSLLYGPGQQQGDMTTNRELISIFSNKWAGTLQIALPRHADHRAILLNEIWLCLLKQHRMPPVLTLRATRAHYVRTTVVPSNGKGRGSESNLNKVWDIGVRLTVPSGGS